MSQALGRQLGLQVGIAIVYLAAARLGLQLALEGTNGSPLWLPSGVAFVALHWFGVRFWPGVFLGAFSANAIALASQTAERPYAVLCVTGLTALGNTLEAVAGSWLARRFVPDDFFSGTRNAYRTMLVFAGAAVVSSLVGPVCGTSTGLVTPPSLLRLMFTWWLGDFTGLLVVVPIIHLARNLSRSPPSDREGREAGVTFLLLVGATWLVFVGPFEKTTAQPLAYIVLPLLMWSALRLPLFFTTFAVAIVVAVAIHGASQGHGPFGMDNVDVALLHLQTFIAIVAGSVLIVGATVVERRRSGDELARLSGSLEQEVARRTEELAHANQQLRTNETRMRALLEALPDFMFRITADGVILDFHAHTEDMLLLPPNAFLHRNIRDTLPPDFARQVQQAVDRVLATGAMQSIEYRLPSIRNPDQVSDFEARLVRSGDREVTSIVRDISERKRFEAEREHVIAELGDKNAELERFTYTVSHDLKSPLITIQGFVDLLRRDLADGDSAAVADDVLEIGTAAEKMRQLLSEVLELSRVGRIANLTEDVSLTEIAEEAWQLVGGHATELPIELSIAAALPTVRGDRVRLREVLQNLLENALKFTAATTIPRIEVGLRTESDREVICFVRDNGVGIPPEHHERVFGLFEKLDAKSEGNGIGLALAKRIVEVHRGRIWVESDGEGHGTTFCVQLPRAG